MKSPTAWLALLSTVAALPALPALPSLPLSAIQARDDAPGPIKNCQPGLNYCFGQIISDLDVDMQHLLHQYCDQQYTFDALSCHACKKLPFPMPTCGASPAAWNSVFTCKSGQSYDFAVRCEHWCEAGVCVEGPGGGAR